MMRKRENVAGSKIEKIKKNYEKIKFMNRFEIQPKRQHFQIIE